MNQFQSQVISKVGARYHRANRDKRAAAALRAVHAHVASTGEPISREDLERIMLSFNAIRELRHP